MEPVAYWANVAQIFQGIGVVAAVLFGVSQWRQQNELARATNTQSLAAHAADFNLKLVENEALLLAWYSFGRIEEGDQTARLRYGELLVQWLILHENIYYQNRKGLLDPLVHAAWESDLKFTARKHNLDLLPRSVREVFPGPYGEHVANLRSSAASQETPSK